MYRSDLEGKSSGFQGAGDGKLALCIRTAALGTYGSSIFLAAAEFFKLCATGGAQEIIHGHEKDLDGVFRVAEGSRGLPCNQE